MKFLLYDLLGRTYLLQYLTDTWSRFIRLQWWSIMWLITLQKNKVHFDFWADDVRFYWPDVFPSFSFKWVFFFFGVFYSPDMLNTSVFSAEWRLIKGRSLSVCAFFSCVSSEADVRAWNSSFFFFLCLKTFRYVSQHNHLPMFPRPSVAEAGDANSCCSFRVFNLQSLLRVRQLRCLKLLYPETQKSIRE